MYNSVPVSIISLSGKLQFHFTTMNETMKVDNPEEPKPGFKRTSFRLMRSISKNVKRLSEVIRAANQYAFRENEHTCSGENTSTHEGRCLTKADMVKSRIDSFKPSKYSSATPIELYAVRHRPVLAWAISLILQNYSSHRA